MYHKLIHTVTCSWSVVSTSRKLVTLARRTFDGRSVRRVNHPSRVTLISHNMHEQINCFLVDDDEINEFLKALAINGDMSPATLTHDDFISFIMSSETSLNWRFIWHVDSRHYSYYSIISQLPDKCWLCWIKRQRKQRQTMPSPRRFCFLTYVLKKY